MSERLLVRAPNHLGDLVMALPALRAAGGADVTVAAWLAPLLEAVRAGDRELGEADGWGAVFRLERGTRALLATAWRLRRRRYDRGVLLTPSLSSALLFRLGGVSRLRGTATDARTGLLEDPVDPGLYRHVHRSAAYWSLVTGELVPRAPTPVVRVPQRLREAWAPRVPASGAPRVGLCPGSHASSRRWDPDRFRELARRLSGRGMEVVVFGGGGERHLTALAAGEWALDLGGQTDLPTLAAGLASCALVVSNDSGPLHLAAAVGVPTVSLWGAGDPVSTGVYGDRHAMLRHPELSCVPCLRNQCPRRGPGQRLEEAERECLRLITVGEVEAAVLDRLSQVSI